MALKLGKRLGWAPPTSLNSVIFNPKLHNPFQRVEVSDRTICHPKEVMAMMENTG
jgi:hypothetical protein